MLFLGPMYILPIVGPTTNRLETFRRTRVMGSRGKSTRDVRAPSLTFQPPKIRRTTGVGVARPFGERVFYLFLRSLPPRSFPYLSIRHHVSLIFLTLRPHVSGDFNRHFYVRTYGDWSWLGLVQKVSWPVVYFCRRNRSSLKTFRIFWAGRRLQVEIEIFE